MVWASINEIVTGARAAMSWLHEVANLHTDEGKAIEWTTPVGFFVRHKYNSTRGAYVRTNLGDRYVVFKMREEDKTLSRTKQRSALSPNFIHSLDATVLVKAVNRLSERGVYQITCVHDSFGVPASQVDLLSQALKDAALETFSGNLLEEFAQNTKLRLNNSEAVPAPPEMGSFDITTLNQSEYFFS
jgi:DNA-directed RNA polymerase